MSSLRRTLSSRADGALYRGPVTPDGKKRPWAIETRILYNEAAAQDADDPVDRMAAAFALLAEKPHPDLLHRYEKRMHLTYQRALHNLILLRTAGKNEPSPISGHSDDPKPVVAPEPPVAPTPSPVEQAVLPADGDCRDHLLAAQAQPNPCPARLHLTYQRDLCSLPRVRTAGKNEPSPISGHSADPKPAEPLASLPSRARQQPSFPPRRAPPLHPPISPSPRRARGWPLHKPA